MLSVIVPTHQERENIEPLLRRLRDTAEAVGEPLELLVVDNGSTDGTVQRAQELIGRLVPGRVLSCAHRRDLARAVRVGLRKASGDIISVMDADLSHPPEVLPALVRAVRAGAQVAVASRYVPGGGIVNWPRRRRWLSRLGNWVVRPLVPVRDATSGYFACAAAFVKPLRLKNRGFKVLLEILVTGRPRRVQEVPYVFIDRVHGRSKMGPKTLWRYGQQVLRLYGYRWRHQ